MKRAPLASIALVIFSAHGAGVMAPRFEVDFTWPKPLPNHWILGQAIGVAVDADDHVWIIHRPAWLEANETHAAANPPTVYRADLVPRSGSEQTGRHPVILMSHDGFNQTPGWRSMIVVPS
jgi:hypothetical protein